MVNQLADEILPQSGCLNLKMKEQSDLPAAKEAAKNISEWIVAAAIRFIEALLSVLVVLASPVRITQRVIGSRDVLVLPHGVFVALVFVGVVLDAHLLEGFLDVSFLCAPGNAQDLVEISVSVSQA